MITVSIACVGEDCQILITGVPFVAIEVAGANSAREGIKNHSLANNLWLFPETIQFPKPLGGLFEMRRPIC